MIKLTYRSGEMNRVDADNSAPPVAADLRASADLGANLGADVGADISGLVELCHRKSGPL
jgi:hypothetical protein